MCFIYLCIMTKFSVNKVPIKLTTYIILYHWDNIMRSTAKLALTSRNMPILYLDSKVTACVVWPLSWKGTVQSLPACSSKMSGPPGCCNMNKKSFKPCIASSHPLTGHKYIASRSVATSNPSMVRVKLLAGMINLDNFNDETLITLQLTG